VDTRGEGESAREELERQRGGTLRMLLKGVAMAGKRIRMREGRVVIAGLDYGVQRGNGVIERERING